MSARSTLLCCSMRLKYCCTNSTQLSSCRSMARWTAAMVVSSIWNLALCAAAYGAHANNATLAEIYTQRGFLLMIFFSLGNRRCLDDVILRHRPHPVHTGAPVALSRSREVAMAKAAACAQSNTAAAHDRPRSKADVAVSPTPKCSARLAEL